ncbi:nucleotidyltransferase domain-containing protein [Rhizobium sp. CB3090]|uniref:nucleotidyltransferase family protein n=1 Tax=Rhizobium sp. CB3090 TaxID=3039156 RepID=UPI0024B210D8|nr:nucleotidyltransferase domain-containing protein [Rhizobium sp. CB3090]WFU10294.1 nucleotidyltransferase domain-containing protein [Rhizobium sp. CB3090]
MADVIRQELEAVRSRVELAFLFRSMVRGDDRADSDVDILIVADLDLFDLGAMIEKLQDVFQREIDLSLYSPQEWKALTDDIVVNKIKNGERIDLIVR